MASDRFEVALATLMRGAAFLSAGLRQGAERGDHPMPIRGPYRAKVIGNGLRELDRFLNLLIDQAVLRQGGVAYPGQHNTANKLDGCRSWIGAEPGDRARLRALGRSRECLFYCAGRVARADQRGGTRMTAGWPELPGTAAPLRCFGLGEELAIDGEDLADIGDFYRRLALDIARHGIVKCATDPHMLPATVAN